MIALRDGRRLTYSVAGPADGFGVLYFHGAIGTALSAGGPYALADVRAEVHVFHGVKDALVPVDHALALAANLPRCRAYMDPDEGHFLFRRRLAEVLAAVTGAREPASAPRHRT
jgi:pimeloyl-ACP methyl ester carboxylesterase